MLVTTQNLEFLHITQSSVNNGGYWFRLGEIVLTQYRLV